MTVNGEGSTGDSKMKNCKVVVSRDGPYLVSGNLPLAEKIIVSDIEGTPVKWEEGRHYPDQEKYDLCRCGRSAHKPYCDKTHTSINFDGTETAIRKEYAEQAHTISGPGLVLTDAHAFCAAARFCHRAGGVWKLTENSDNTKSREIAIQETWDCPSGRLVVWDRETGKPIEPQSELRISLVENPREDTHGPIWLGGGIPLESSDGTGYETRNRVTLCRCGKSENKPFCDGNHT